MALLSHYPELLKPMLWSWGPTQAQFETFGAAPPEDQIANVNIVPSTADGWLILQLANGQWEIPGGTKESGETWLRARGAGLHPPDYLSTNDSYHFFKQLGDDLHPGPTGTNVNDLTFLFGF
jgi:hypothetical protein